MEVIYRGKERTVIEGKIRHYNKVMWLLEDGLSFKEVRATLFEEKTERIRERLHGKQRQGAIKREKGKITKALRQCAEELAS